MGVLKSTWSPRTCLHKAQESAEKDTAKHGTANEWVYTRGIILRVIGRFPDAIAAVREALAAARRTTLQETNEPA